jgi:WD40 repeat protein
MHISIKKQAQLTGHQGAIFTLIEGRTPTHVISGAGDGWLVEWDLTNPDLGKLIAKTASNIYSAYFLKEKNVLIAGDMDGGVHFINLDDTTKNKDIAHHKTYVFDIKKIGNHIYTLGGDGMLTKWDIDNFKSLESHHLSSKSLRSLDYSPEKNELAVGASDGNIYFLNPELELLRIIKKAHNSSVFTIKYVQNGDFLLTGGRDALLKLWDLSQNTVTPSHDEAESIKGVNIVPSQSISAHWYTINAIACHPHIPTIFATASRDKTIKIWQINTEGVLVLQKVIDTIRYGCHTHSVNALYWSPFNNQLISASDDRTLIVWDIIVE